MIRLTFRTVKDPSFWRPNNARFVIIWGKWGGGSGGLGQGKKLLLASRPWVGWGGVPSRACPARTFCSVRTEAQSELLWKTQALAGARGGLEKGESPPFEGPCKRRSRLGGGLLEASTPISQCGVGIEKAASRPQRRTTLELHLRGWAGVACTFCKQLRVISISESPAFSHSYPGPQGSPR